MMATASVPAHRLGTSLQRIVYLGPSLSHEAVTALAPEIDVRPPIQRGDLDTLAGRAIVGIVDGLFDQTLAISPGEIREAIGRGVTVFGSASMGALRAAEVPRVHGVGRIYEMYRTGIVERDDEVAVLLDADTFEAVTEPLVNVRYAVERLVRSGSISRTDGTAIIESAAALHYTERTYPRIIATSSLARNQDRADIIALLRSFNLKREDAITLIEAVAIASPDAPSGSSGPYVIRERPDHPRIRTRESIGAPVHIWESGDRVDFLELIDFLKVTGRFDSRARDTIGRLALGGAYHEPPDATSWLNHPSQSSVSEQALLDAVRVQWGWDSPEEAHVTLVDLGVGLDDITKSLAREVELRSRVASIARNAPLSFVRALRIGLWMDGLALKREALRLGSLVCLAEMGARAGPPTKDEIVDARRTICRLRHGFRWANVAAGLSAEGLGEHAVDAYIRRIAFARRAGRELVSHLETPSTDGSLWVGGVTWDDLGLEPSPKAPESARFSLSETGAAATTDRIARQMGIVRVSLVGELDTLGVYIAQAFGDRIGWSSSFSSGKSTSRDGARVGSIMEEVEIHAQDSYLPIERRRVSFRMGRRSERFVDPADLGLPFDTRYDEDLEIEWSPMHDLLGGGRVWVPTAMLVGERQPNDILYCARLGGKVFSSSGLGSGFTMAEAIVHAACEYIERHAYRLAELQLDNPGEVGGRAFRFIDERTLPSGAMAIVNRYLAAGMMVRILDITSEVAVPTFFVRVFDDPFTSYRSISSDGFAAHPNPSVALTMALLESAQTRGGYIAGGREDYSLQARSLGRHERPRTAVPRLQSFWFSNDRPSKPFPDVAGFAADDILTELRWIVGRVEEAGLSSVLVADLTCDNIVPARAVRVIIPGLETTNPMHTGLRARAILIRDLLPVV